ncbi:ABC transporter ATP-binding protein [Leucobacter luti]|uniref:ABC transporter ATP-binding protein n=1 Tax=Leucobacter luti TaxID=340320 RepID=UPI003D088D94
MGSSLSDGLETSAVSETSAATADDTLLDFRDVDVFYGEFHALQNVSYRIGRGEIVSLLGGNACGKSTTMKSILRLVKTRAGSITFDGRDITRASTAEVVRLGIASVPEARRVFPEMTVEENLLVGAHTRSGRARSRAVLADLDAQYSLFPRLFERRTQQAGTLSGGEQQMLAFGRALMSRPQLICMDEPTMGLAPIIVDQVLESIQRINRELGVAVFIVEQSAELALQVAHRGYVLTNGVVAMQGSAEELLADPRIREAYLGAAVAA